MTHDPRHTLGRRGELLAAAHLRGRGQRVLACNVRTREGEIDMIASDGRTLVFVEVKTRRIGCRQTDIRADQRPLLGLSPRKRARLRRLAVAWLHDQRAARPRSAMIRFDAIGVVLDTRGELRSLEHLEGAW